MKLQNLLSFVRRAVDDYNMIQDGDRIAIGISGGKDSLALLLALRGLQRFYPKKFELEAITISLGFDNFDLDGVKKLCDEIGVRYTIKNTDIAQVVFDERKEKNPCSLCSKMRKGALNDVAKSLNCNKVALGHNKDDVIQTLLLSMFYEGRIYTFSPVSYLDRTDLYTIRPLIYVPEKGIINFSQKEGLPIVISPCPADGNT
ncbi:MAG TPA: tRNA 2-thiocytidine biosynthesis TtcA family protein, partial [Defluviitaleaceae bacterium]|nr:tRNA 2-thiocytidine biosynthesis TtcA family protein [Defluviitaleaceae bacterium]